MDAVILLLVTSCLNWGLYTASMLYSLIVPSQSAGPSINLITRPSLNSIRDLVYNRALPRNSKLYQHSATV